MILLWGLPGDPPLDAVHAALRRAGRPVFLLDQRAILDTAAELRVDGDLAGRLRVGDRGLDLRAVTAVYVRPHDWTRLPTLAAAGPDSPAWEHAAQVDDLLQTWVELTPALVVNRPSAMASNNSKPYQAAAIGALGFATPETLITTDPAAAAAFWAAHGAVIYKSISGVRSIVSRLGPVHRDRLADLAWCPTQFQEYVAGDDFRVHVVGGEIFASRITSAADDYRYAGRQGAAVAIAPCELPRDCAERCARLAAALRLHVAGIDLRRTPAGRWYCFEVNPSPGFTYYQDATGQPIDDAIARFLAGARSGGGSDRHGIPGCRSA